MKTELSPLISPRQLAEILGVKPGTIFSWLSRGVDLPPSIRIVATTRWRPEAVARWIEAKEKQRKQRSFEE